MKQNAWHNILATFVRMKKEEVSSSCWALLTWTEINFRSASMLELVSLYVTEPPSSDQVIYPSDVVLLTTFFAYD
jgi:hypothetical protein